MGDRKDAVLRSCKKTTCPIEHSDESSSGMKISSLIQTPIFGIAIILMVCAGASELSMAQWASAYTESALGLSKAVGDLARTLRIPERVIAVRFIALGTSLPELITSLMSLLKGYGNVGLGNIIGANILNLLLVIGIPAV